MIRENQRLLNQLHVITDALAVLLAMLAAYWLRFSLFRGDRAMPLSHYVWLGLGAAVLTLILLPHRPLPCGGGPGGGAGPAGGPYRHGRHVRPPL